MRVPVRVNCQCQGHAPLDGIQSECVDGCMHSFINFSSHSRVRVFLAVLVRTFNGSAHRGTQRSARNPSQPIDQGTQTAAALGNAMDDTAWVHTYILVLLRTCNGRRGVIRRMECGSKSPPPPSLSLSLSLEHSTLYFMGLMWMEGRRKKCT